MAVLDAGDVGRILRLLAGLGAPIIGRSRPCGFSIVSKDSGFDALIAHLQKRGLDVARWPDLTGRTAGAHDTPARLGILPSPPQPDLDQ